MDEYIEREAAMTVPVLPKEHREYQTFNLDDAYEQGWNDALENLVNVPTADVATVRHGMWLEVREKRLFGEHYFLCSNCKSRNGLMIPFNYCPNCGSKMDG